MPETKPKVILLEDAEDIRLLMSRLLVSYGCEPFILSDEEEIFRLADQQNIDLALIDIMLPGLDGRDVARELRNRGARFPIYFMTGVQTAIRESDLAHVDGVLKKPFSICRLREVLDATIGVAAQASMPPQADQKTLELMTAVATEKEALQRQEERLLETIRALRDQGADATEEQIQSLIEQRSASLDHIASLLGEIEDLLKG